MIGLYVYPSTMCTITTPATTTPHIATHHMGVMTMATHDTHNTNHIRVTMSDEMRAKIRDARDNPKPDVNNDNVDNTLSDDDYLTDGLDMYRGVVDDDEPLSPERLAVALGDAECEGCPECVGYWKEL